MIWIISVVVFVVGVFSGLVLFAYLEKKSMEKVIVMKFEDVLDLVSIVRNEQNPPNAPLKKGRVKRSRGK